ncbi:MULTISPECIES: motility protein A [Piscirickettsiaceae]|jgi:chemotaxis protein MotA|uniref:Flagellar motor protein MotA n=1 Tax=Hydrogenovibrio thermophilus TaxID=265883 RepID=A0A451G506_9GAMM|nr:MULTISPECIES: MotA/TolQ/ExbB proton channel family protein [Piscirickettsiaceae]AZR82833.1 flagellar motor protein MotA [Thiomicrospira sp. S5]QAB14575.1 flagellar motor protein MotA [Hydrogenovibrio thermophilus]
MSKLATFIGVFFGSLIVLLSMVDFEKGQLLSAFFNFQGLLVVLGGTFAATLINYPLSQMGCFFRGIGKVFASEPESENEAIEQIVYLSHIAQSKGVLALEKEIELISDSFLRFALSEMMVYRDKEHLATSLENHLNAMRLRHLNCQDVFNNMASYAPAFGMMGTVMGLIMMMTSQVGGDAGTYTPGQSDDMLNNLLQGMGLALVTTFYGVLFANFVFIPIAGKLKVLSDAEALKNEILMYGVLGLKNEQPPLLLRESLTAFVNEKNKERLELTLR